MKIWGEIPRISGIYNKIKSTAKAEITSAAASKNDVVSISSQAKDYQVLIKALKDVPDIRKDKVEEIKAKIEAGTYDVNGRDIADKIIKSIIDWKA